MEHIVCTCKKCGWTWGELLNLWIQVGKGYIGPTIHNDELNIIPLGEVRLGEQQTLVDKCHLQDVACGHCRTIVGLKCVETPTNHVLHEKQLLLRISSVVITTSQAGCSVPPNIGRTLKLRQAANNGFQNPPVDANGDGARQSLEKDNITPSLDDDLYFSRLEIDLETQREDIQKINSAGCEAVSTFNNAIKRIDEEVMRFKSNASQIRQDLNGSTSRTDNIEKEITFLKDKVEKAKQGSQDTTHFDRLEGAINSAGKALTKVRDDLSSGFQRSEETLQKERSAWKAERETTRNDIECLRHELDDTKKIARESISTAKTYSEDIVSLRAEVGLLRQELSHNPTQKSLSTDGAFPSREIDILTSSIARISQRASQVETLQMEFELLKGRVQRMESQKEVTKDDMPKGQPEGGIVPLTDDLKRRWSSAFPRQHIIGSDGSSNYSQVKGSAMGNWSSSPSGTYESISSPPSARTEPTNLDVPSSARLTKSGAIDKRFLKRAKHTAPVKKKSNG